MDSVDLFRKLGSGAKFNLKRFGKDAERFKAVKSTGSSAVCQLLAGIDYFGAEQRYGAEREAGREEDGNEVERGVKRKQVEERSGRKKKTKMTKKKEEEEEERGDPPQEVADGDGDGIRWTSCLEKKTKSLQQEGKETSLKRLKHLHQEQVNRIRAQHRINVHGYDVPDPLCTFQELQSQYHLNPRVLQNLQDAGLSKPTPIQMQAIPLMMHGREVLACAPTGSGKTLAFCLPLLAQLQQPTNHGLRALIIAPTRELASQTHRELLRLSEGVGFRVHIIDKASMAAKKYGPQSNKKWDILVSTPNRLIYLLQQEPPGLDLSSVEWLVVDESDKLFEEGNEKTGFREQLAIVFQACSGPRVRRAFFSATCSLPVEQWCRLNLDNLVAVNIGHRNVAVETVHQELLFVGKENGKLLAIRDIIKKGFLPPMLVFVQSIERARELFHELVYEGINVEVIHAERTQQQRDNVVASFRSGKIWVLICTALLARGIDFKGVNLVLNYDFPTSAVEYIHRIGRTGRAGHHGKAITFFTEDDKPLLRSIANVIKQAGCPVPDYMVGFKKTHSKVRQRLQRRPPRRHSIATTPRCLLRKHPKRLNKPAQEGAGAGTAAEKKKGGKRERKSEGMSGQANRLKKLNKSSMTASKSSPPSGKKRKNKKDKSQAS